MSYVDKKGQKHEFCFNEYGSTYPKVVFEDQYGNTYIADPSKLLTGTDKDIYLWAVTDSPYSKEHLKIQQYLNKQPLKANNKKAVEQVFNLPDKFKDGTFGVAASSTWTYS